MFDILKNVTKIETTHSVEQVNKLLEQGWILIYVGQYSDPPHIYETEFILARTQ